MNVTIVRGPKGVLAQILAWKRRSELEAAIAKLHRAQAALQRAEEEVYECRLQLAQAQMELQEFLFRHE